MEPRTHEEQMITGYPRCQVKKLQDEIAGKPLTNENLVRARILLKTLEDHEKQIRALRQKIEEKIYLLSIDKK